MAVDRYVLLGLAHVRSAWFREVSRWSTSASLPIEFVKAMSLEEVRTRLASGRGYSALLVDDDVPGLDRDLIDAALEAGCTVIVVDSGRTTRSWPELGASAVVPADLDPTTLLQALAQLARPIGQVDADITSFDADPTSDGYRGRVIAVTGPGGTGASTVAIALAQGLARDPRHASMVCLADLALHAEQAMLHGSPDVVPGVQELVDAHRLGHPSTDAVRELTWPVEARGYHLLLGLRRHRDWTSLRPRALAAALDGLRRGFRLVVADVDDDVEGERATGSVDVEERNSLARTTLSLADVVVVVGSPGMKGLHSLLRCTREVLELGVPAHRVVPLVNRSPKSPRGRAEVTRAYGSLLTASGADPAVPSPLHLSERRQLDLALRDGVALPEAWFGSVPAAVARLLDDLDEGAAPTRAASRAPVPVAPGSLGSWTDQDGEEELA